MDHLHLSVEDEASLRRLVARYTVAADKVRPAETASLFTVSGAILIHDYSPGAPAEEPSRAWVGREEIAAGIRGLAERFDRTAHVLGQSLFHPDGTGACGETYCVAHHLYSPAGYPVDRVLVLRYLDRFEREDCWRFAERRLRIEIENQVPVSGPLVPGEPLYAPSA